MSADLCHMDEVPDRGSRGFDPHGRGRDTIFVVRRGNVVKGWRDSCPHIDGAPMAWKKNAYLSADRETIMCYAHGATFDIDTGVCLKGPCEGLALTPVLLMLEPNGRVCIETDSSVETYK